ncbi:MAG: hypothetical protein IKG40_02980 [Bacilli bacterium]|nr:hypothetical protein [Bacilli bacterium]
MNEETKEKLKQFVGQDGKIIITDDMPDDLKAAINFLNENDVDIFSPNTIDSESFEPEVDEETEEDEELEETGGIDNYDFDDEVDDTEIEELDDFL